MFRSGELEVLIGTDSMSEGLNLQTSGRLINYDMPWNLMRVEQRIGRVDRIGASYKDIRISNYFYADTVEEQVYKGIAEDYGDFTDIVGDAAPVLANVEKAIEALALGDNVSDAEVAVQVADIKSQVDDLNNIPVQAGDMGAAPEVIGHVDPPPVLIGATTNDTLERVLTTNPLTAPLLSPDEGAPGTYRLALPVASPPLSFAANAGPENAAAYTSVASGGPTVPVTFDRGVWDASSDDALVFLTYGSPELEALLPRNGQR